MLSLILILLFAALSVIHVYWLIRGPRSMPAVIPTRDGKPAFIPSRLATFLVATGLLCCAGLVAALSGWIRIQVPPGQLTLLGDAIAGAFLLRAIGDFRLLGFFKRVRGTKFALLDTVLYSPLCLGIAAGVFWITLRRAP